MSELTWSAEDVSGVPMLDQLHQDLVDSLNALSDAGDEEFKSRYGELVEQVEHAFEKEEEWMEEIDFQSQRSHREQHARVLGALHHVHSRVMNGELEVGRHVVDELLPQWLALHISTMDASLARAMQIAHVGSACGIGNRLDPAHALH